MTTPDPPALLTPKQLAEGARVSVNRVQRWCREGRIPAQRHGGQWRIDPQALERADPDLWAEYSEGLARLG